MSSYPSDKLGSLLGYFNFQGALIQKTGPRAYVWGKQEYTSLGEVITAIEEANKIIAKSIAKGNSAVS